MRTMIKRNHRHKSFGGNEKGSAGVWRRRRRRSVPG